MNRKQAKTVACPRCGWSDFRVAHRSQFLDYVMALLALAPLRCRKCRMRFYRPWFLVTILRAGAGSMVETRAEPGTRIESTAFATEATTVVSSTGPVVLIVDEDQAMRRLLTRLLDRAGFSVREAASPQDADVELEGREIDLVVANLPDEDEPVISRWRSAQPGLSILAFSNAIETSFVSEAMDPTFLTLSRPTRPRDVVKAAQRMLSVTAGA